MSEKKFLFKCIGVTARKVSKEGKPDYHLLNAKMIFQDEEARAFLKLQNMTFCPFVPGQFYPFSVGINPINPEVGEPIKDLVGVGGEVPTEELEKASLETKEEPPSTDESPAH